MSGPQQIQHLSSDAVFAALRSHQAGLSEAEVEERLREVGPNSLEMADPYKWLRNLAKQFTNFFTLLLIGAAGVCFLADAIQPGENMGLLGGALLGVSLLNAAFSFFQEYRAERAMEALGRFLPQKVWVRRADNTQQILAERLVPGDVLLLREGDRVPADARLVLADRLLVNNAPLTGESQPLSLQAAACGEEQGASEADNLVFGGCSVQRGSGEAVVFATGLRTEFGRLAHLSGTVRKDPSPLEHATAQMVRVLTVIAIGMGLSFFLYGVFAGRSLWMNLVFMMGIIVANVPEGLLPTFTLALAMGSLRMAKKNVLVRRLSAVEGLGAVHVVCTDKTGTLTENRLSLTRLSGARLEAPLDTRRLCLLALLASDVRQAEDGLLGDPLDVAVARYAEQEGFPPSEELMQPTHHFPFEVARRRAAGVGLVQGQRTFAVKGAWEALRPLLSGLADGNACLPAEAQALEAAEQTLRGLAQQGLRVIAVASRPMADEEEFGEDSEPLEHGLIFQGFLGVEDPLRAEVPGAVERCRQAGIQVIMITGDHPDTALAIARKAGILPDEPGEGCFLSGDQLRKLRQSELTAELERGVRVFARTSPEQKMQIVAALKEMDLVVAMTGDGVNDAPALKAADVGIALGSGTDVARESAQVVLLDDNFASIVDGVEEGRTVYANIRKFTNYVLVSNGPEILPYLLYILLRVPLAMTVIQILAIDLGTDIIPSMALGQEPSDSEQMQSPPRARGEGLLSFRVVAHSYFFLGLLEAGWSMFLFFLVLSLGGWSYGEIPPSTDMVYRAATGVALSSILLMQIGNLIGRRFALRSGLDRGLFANRLMLAGIAIQIVFSWGVLYFPPLQTVLGTAPVSPGIYLLAWLGIPLIFGCDYLRKRWRARQASV